FLVECKAHVQPYTTRQHCNHLQKLNENTKQLNRIAEYYLKNIELINKKLDLPIDFKPEKVNKLVLTTAMIGQPMRINGCYIIDESAFTMIVDRVPPSLKYYDKGTLSEIPSDKFAIFNGELTAQKL